MGGAPPPPKKRIEASDIPGAPDWLGGLLGPINGFTRAVAAALARGPEALRALDKVLSDTSTEWRRLREQQKKDAARGQ